MKLAVDNPLAMKEVKITNIMGILKLFGGGVLLYVMYKMATQVGDKVLGKTNKVTHLGQQDPDPYAGISVV